MGGWIVYLAKRLAVVGTMVALLKMVLRRGGDGSDVRGTLQLQRNLTIDDERDKNFLKVFHLDFKGGPPKMSYLVSILPVARAAGANAILIEYEDMFPFAGPLKNISAGNAYSLGEVQQLLTSAKSLKMEVIPLIQTFGHLEYVLKLEEFKDLRESEDFPQEICPSKKEAMDLVKEIIRQIMKIHVGIRYIHIGCDEVRHLGVCLRCSRLNPKKVFAKHVKRTAYFVRSQYPGITPLIWDDMLRVWTFDDLVESGLATAVQPVVWVYGNNISGLVPRFVWNMYRRIFPQLWVASAFKGAFGEKEVLPDLKRHLGNSLSWMRQLNEEKKEVEEANSVIAGVVVTGWSRYDHFAVLCELLPVSLPSLILSLLFLDSEYQNNRLSGFSKWMNLLQCPENFLRSDLAIMEKEELFKFELGKCCFPGSDLYEALVEFLNLRANVEKMVKKVETSGWLARYNVEKNFTSPWRVFKTFSDEGFAGEFLRKNITIWKSFFAPIMNQYFDTFTVSEWEEQNIQPLERKIKNIQTTVSHLVTRKAWPRRPLG